MSAFTETPPQSTSEDFAVIYRENVAAMMGFFARHGVDAQTVADLTSETFAQAIGSLATFDPARGAPGRGCMQLPGRCMRAIASGRPASNGWSSRWPTG